MRKVRKLKHPKVVKVIKIAKQSTQGVGMIFGEIGKHLQPFAKQGFQNLKENARQQAKEQYGSKRLPPKIIKVIKKKRIVKVKKRKKYRR